MLISLFALAASAAGPAPTLSHHFAPGKLRVLILSGRNNHDWRTTTPQLARKH